MGRTSKIAFFAGIAICALPSAAQAATRCEAKSLLSRQLLDQGQARADSSVSATSYEVTEKGEPRRTLYLEAGGYLVSVCGADGSVHEEQYVQVKDADGSYSPAAIAASDMAPDGSSTGTSYHLGDPAGATAVGKRAQREWKASATYRDALKVARAEKTRSFSRAARQPATAHGLAPGRVGLMTSPEAKPKAKARARSAQVIGNKCWQYEYGYAYNFRWTTPWLGYFTAFGGGWPNTSIGYGIATWTGTYSFCGFSPSLGLSGYWYGDIPNMAVQNDGFNHVGWGWGAPCDQYNYAGVTNYSAGAFNGSYYPLVDTDIRFNVNCPWTHGALPGYYDLWSVAAHEFGHAFGALADLTGYYAQDQIMYWQARMNDTDQRHLGWGDYSGMRARYP